MAGPWADSSELEIVRSGEQSASLQGLGLYLLLSLELISWRPVLGVRDPSGSPQLLWLDAEAQRRWASAQVAQWAAGWAGPELDFPQPRFMLLLSLRWDVETGANSQAILSILQGPSQSCWPLTGGLLGLGIPDPIELKCSLLTLPRTAFLSQLLQDGEGHCDDESCPPPNS